MRKIKGLETLIALGIAAGGVMYSGCDGDDVTVDDGGDVPTETDADVASDDAYTNHAPDPIDVSSITPADGSAYNVGDRIPVGFDVPNDEDGDELTGIVHVTGDSDATPGPSAGDYSTDVPISGPLTSGSHVSQDIDTATAGPGGAAIPTRADGSATPYTLELILEDGRGGEARASRNVTITGENPNAPTIRCRVNGASVGLGFNIACGGTSPLGDDLYGNWASSITPTITGVSIDADGYITGIVPGPSEISLYDLEVVVHDNHGNSTTYNNKFFVDANETHATFDSNSTLIPEDFADELAQECGEGFNAANKPTSSAQPNYVFEISRAANGDAAMTCVSNWVSSLDSERAKTMLIYTPAGETLEAFVGGEPNLVQLTYRNNE